jgi:SPP1 family predicted phage head-tail adaptor
MRAGSLDRTILIQRRGTGLDFNGDPVDTWSTIATMRAQKLENAISDRESVRGNVTENVITFRMRWLALVTLEDRVSYEGQQFKITRIVELGRRRGMDLMCDRVGP